ncbi:hypothetical protein [Streptomyces anulatus]|uniref:hypothetical protein n=1 Tax=Streptomyces anulatus TaxID=1892 RepID=UPI002ED66CE2|nr:hypothetical protein OG703_33815 [Streptomyces anulatus]
MARLQILELPEGTGDDRPPFVLVVDQCQPQRIALGIDSTWQDHWQQLADKIGARGVIVTPGTIGIPANDTTAFAQPSATALHLDDHEVRADLAAAAKDQAEAIDALRGDRR